MQLKTLVNLDEIDLDNLEHGKEQIRQYNPQRFEFEQLDGIIAYEPQKEYVIGVKEVSEDEFWVRGHIPGRPLLPGVLMCEAAAQLSSYYFKRFTETDRFVGFGGMDDVKFRATVEPGDRLILGAKVNSVSRRFYVMDCQGFVDGKMVFHGAITGMPV